MNSGVMTLRRTVRMVMMMMMILLDFTNDIWMLPAPSRVSMESMDMRHTLRWRPLQASCNTTILYSVRYQGEFELLLRNGSWVDAAECQQIPHTHCDLTLDLGSDSNYNLQVRAQCGSQLSAWTDLSQPFNRRDTVLTVPEMMVTTTDNALQVLFDRLPLTAAVSVTVWKEGDELQAVVYSMPAGQSVLPVPVLQETAVYCVSAQIVLDSWLHSSSTDTHCVPITGPNAATWKTPITLTVTVIIVAVLLFALFWSIAHCRPEACQTYFHKEPLPPSLKGEWDIQIPIIPQEEELCETISMVRSVDPCVDAALTAHLEDRTY